MKRPGAHIEIMTGSGKRITFSQVNSCKVVTSLHTLTDTCTLTVGRKRKWKDEDVTDLTEIIRRGDQITIKLGYGDALETVFQGYLKAVKTGTPVTIECENEAWKLKQMPIANKYYESLTMSAFVNEFMSGYQVSAADVNFGEVRINGDTTVAGVLDYFMKNYPVRFFFRDGKFYGTLAHMQLMKDEGVQTHKFKWGMNVDSDNLSYTLADDVKVQIVAKVILQDNTKLEVKEPQDATDAGVRTFMVPTAKSEDDLKKFAQDKLATYKVDKMEGTFTALGEPLVRKGDLVHYYDDEHTERNDKKFVADAVTYSYGMGGYRQEITLGTEIK
jgi:hypothetical protein